MTRYCALSEGVMVIEPNAYYHKGVQTPHKRHLLLPFCQGIIINNNHMTKDQVENLFLAVMAFLIIVMLPSAIQHIYYYIRIILE